MTILSGAYISAIKAAPPITGWRFNGGVTTTKGEIVEYVCPCGCRSAYISAKGTVYRERRGDCGCEIQAQ